jgi:hypothetical protein
VGVSPSSQVAATVRRHRIFTVLAPALALTCVSAAGQTNPIDSLAPGHWLELADTRVRAHAPPEFIDGSFIGDVEYVMKAWSGGAFDPVNDRFLLRGGGHIVYGGNEIYALDVNTLQLSRAWGPSPFAGWQDQDLVMPDGAPVASHSCDHLEYIPSTNSFCTFTNPANWQYDVMHDYTSYCVDLDVGEWRTVATMPDNAGQCMFSAFHPGRGTVFIHGGGKLKYLKEYDPVADTWRAWGTIWSDANFYFSDRSTAALDHDRDLFVMIGDGDFIVWDISGAPRDVTGQAIASTGDNEIVDARAPGFVYDPVHRVFVAWDGGADVYVIDPDDWHWRRIAPAPGNTVVPTGTADTQGTFGRFQYMPSKNAFIAVSSVDANMFVYRLDLPRQVALPPWTLPVWAVLLGWLALLGRIRGQGLRGAS